MLVKLGYGLEESLTPLICGIKVPQRGSVSEHLWGLELWVPNIRLNTRSAADNRIFSDKNSLEQ